MHSLLIASQEARNFENLASHANFLRGSLRVPAPLKSVGQESVTNPLITAALEATQWMFKI